ncbi:hypothetical protein [Mycobacterium hubeiense]|uniref:hypothetical protein n=1 Tax=Mycobacterium hubeiense TaxID=1867256 RepID=UPI0011571486|nr:hypothetical protein [Mycobacterium sp. QGD 101]
MAALIVGYAVGRLCAIPGTTEFWRIAAQPAATLTAGIAAVSAALIAAYQVRQTRNQDHRHHRNDEIWKRFEWVVDRLTSATGSNSATAPALTPKQASEMLESIKNAADDLDDPHLSVMIGFYMGNELGDLKRAGVDLTPPVREEPDQ